MKKIDVLVSEDNFTDKEDYIKTYPTYLLYDNKITYVPLNKRKNVLTEEECYVINYIITQLLSEESIEESKFFKDYGDILLDLKEKLTLLYF